METKITAGVDEQFSELKDPRIDRTKHHALIDIMVIAICAVICGADTWEDVEAFGRAKQAWFERFLEMPNGIPSHDTFNRVFNRLDAQQFQNCFMKWISAVSELIPGQVIAIDGKLLRRSHDKGCHFAGYNRPRIDTRGSGKPRLIGSVPGLIVIISCWDRSKWTTNPTRLLQSRNCSKRWKYPAPS